MQELALIQPGRSAEKEFAQEAAAVGLRRDSRSGCRMRAAGYRVARGVLRTARMLKMWRKRRCCVRTGGSNACGIARGFARGSCVSHSGLQSIEHALRSGAKCAKRFGRDRRLGLDRRHRGQQRISSASRPRMEELSEKHRLVLLLAAMEGIRSKK